MTGGPRPTRRLFLAAATSLLLPRAARAQEAGRTYRVGFISFNPRSAPIYAGLFEELARAGFVDGGNLTVDPQGFNVTAQRLQQVAEAVIATNPDAIVCSGDPIARTVLHATTMLPIVANCDDLVRNGFVASLARPGGNLTGVSILSTELDGKRQELLIDLVPGIRRLAAMADSSTTGPDRLAALQQAAAARGVELSLQYIANGAEIAPAVEQARAGGAQAINLLASALLYAHRRELIERIAAARLPAIYQFPEIVEEDALMGYGPRLASIYRDLVAPKLIKVLRGVKPADIPAEQPTAFELGINLKTVKALGLTVPPLLLAQANEVIE